MSRVKSRRSRVEAEGFFLLRVLFDESFGLSFVAAILKNRYAWRTIR